MVFSRKLKLPKIKKEDDQIRFCYFSTTTAEGDTEQVNREPPQTQINYPRPQWRD